MDPLKTRKFAVISHVAPSSRSGQAIVLDRILGGIDADDYVVISLEQSAAESEGALPGKFFRLGMLPRLPYLESIPVLSWLLHLLNALWLIPLRAVQIAAIVRHEKVDRLVACSGNLYLIPAAALVGRWTGKSLTLYMFDDFILQWPGFPRILARAFEKFAVKSVDTIIVPNEFIEKIYEERYDISVSIVRNPCNVSEYVHNNQLPRQNENHKISIVYAGSIYHAHYDAFKNLLSALESLKDLPIKLHVYTSQAEAQLAAYGIRGPFLAYHPHIPSTQVPEVLQRADILFLPLAFQTSISEVITTSSPGKLGEYLSAGVPVLVHAPRDSFMAWFFRRNACGFVVDHPEVTALAETIQKIVSDRSLVAEYVERARRCAENDFDTKSVRQKFLAVIWDRAA